jgi:gliding motility-associated-like protein
MEACPFSAHGYRFLAFWGIKGTANTFSLYLPGDHSNILLYENKTTHKIRYFMMKPLLLAGVSVLLALSFAYSQDCNNFSLSVTPDTTLCGPFASVTLSGTATFAPFEWAWSPADGLSATDQASVTAQPSGNTTYTLTARAIGENLIFNGDFGFGAVGFTTDYDPASGGPNGPLDNEGEYAVDNNPNNTHQDFAACGDHTTGSGNMLIVNSSGNPDQVWCQVVSVQPNTDYAFSAWATSVFPENPANLQFSFDGNLLGAVFNASPVTCDWQQFSATWNSGANTDVEICIANVNNESSGNDFAIDDIEFGPICEASEEVTVTLAGGLPPPQPECAATTTSISLSWPAVPGATGYEVNVLNAGPGSFTADTVYTIDGLSPGQTVDMELLSLQGACSSDQLLAFSCTTLECPDYSISVLEYDTVVCEGENVALQLDIDTDSEGPFSVVLDVNGLPSTFNNLSAGSNTIDLQITANSTLAFTSFVDEQFPACVVGDLPAALEVIVETPPNAGQDILYSGCAGVPELLQLEELLQGADEGGRWQVSAGGGSLGSAFDPVGETVDFFVLSPGVYALQYIVEGTACANDTASFELTLFSSPDVDAGGAITLDCSLAEAQLGSPDGGQGYRYAWQTIEGESISPIDVAQPTVSTAGIYVVQVLDPTTGCSVLDTAIVTSDFSSPEPIASVIPNNCPGDIAGTIVIDTVLNGNGPFVYSLDGESFGPEAIFTDLAAGNYTVTVQDVGGCEGTASVQLQANNSFTAAITASPGTQIQQGTTVSLMVNYTSPAGQEPSISWSPAPDSCQACPQISVQPTQTQLYTVTLTDEQGCTVSDTILIMVDQERRVYAPNAFSPNDDGVNDRYFFNAGPEFTRGLKWQILNRWGGLVFEAEDFMLNDPAAGWDGTFKGESLSPGVYTFAVILELSDGSTYQIGGSLHLIR